VLFGPMAVHWPAIAVTVLVLLFGAYALVDGVLTLATAMRWCSASRSSPAPCALHTIHQGGAAGASAGRPATA
jgi:uncharacterized membrane protein HdeD (DUF308 family)